MRQVPKDLPHELRSSRQAPDLQRTSHPAGVGTAPGSGPGSGVARRNDSYVDDIARVKNNTRASRRAGCCGTTTDNDATLRRRYSVYHDSQCVAVTRAWVATQGDCKAGHGPTTNDDRVPVRGRSGRADASDQRRVLRRTRAEVGTAAAPVDRHTPCNARSRTGSPGRTLRASRTGGTGAPVAPVAPCGPAGPAGPCGPVGPAGPTAPGAPGAPTSPCGPCGPVAPTSAVPLPHAPAALGP